MNTYDFKEKLAKIDELNELKADIEQELAPLKLRLQGMAGQVSQYQQDIDALKADIKEQLVDDGCVEHKQDGLLFKLRKQPQKLEVMCKPEELPEEYQRIKVEADKAKLKAEYKEGLSANYCKLSDVDYKLVIEHE